MISAPRRSFRALRRLSLDSPGALNAVLFLRRRSESTTFEPFPRTARQARPGGDVALREAFNRDTSALSRRQSVAFGPVSTLLPTLRAVSRCAASAFLRLPSVRLTSEVL